MMSSGCREPEVRAATLVHTPGALTLGTVHAPEGTPTAVSCLGDGVLLALVEPGRLAAALRHGPSPAAAAALAYSCAPCGGAREHGRLNLLGTMRAVATHERRDVALRLYEVAAREELLDAVDGEGWLLVSLQISGADWALPTGTHPFDPATLWRAEVDQVLRFSPSLCARLNAAHPELAPQLIGQPVGWLAELDSEGATIGTPGDGGDPDYLRVPWPSKCRDLNELHHLLVHCGPYRPCRGGE
jgi:hypothetical protein